MAALSYDLSMISLNERFADAEPIDLLRWTAETWPGRVVMACSFGAEDMVLLHLLATHKIAIRPFVLDTGRLHQETYEVWEAARRRLGLQIEGFTPDAARLRELLAEKGPNSFYDSVANRKECCGIRKVEPLRRALEGNQAWITGLRQGQSTTRTSLQSVELDADHDGMYKVNPLVHWTEDEVWHYLREHDVPYNRLHDQGFPSIGCAPCTRAISPGEDVRAGRWWWEAPEHRECGLHLRQAK